MRSPAKTGRSIEMCSHVKKDAIKGAITLFWDFFFKIELGVFSITILLLNAMVLVPVSFLPCLSILTSSVYLECKSITNLLVYSI